MSVKLTKRNEIIIIIMVIHNHNAPTIINKYGRRDKNDPQNYLDTDSALWKLLQRHSDKERTVYE